MKLIDLKLGKVDGKADFSDAKARSSAFRESFLMPENVRFEDFDTGDRYFVQGFRGTGKTSLLRYYMNDRQSNSKFRRLILFKSSVDEDQRVEISRQAGFEIVETDSGKMGISQDFKSVWRWFILHKIGEMIKDSPDIAVNPPATKTFLALLGLNETTSIQKSLGILPKLEGANVKISGDVGIIKAELSADFTPGNKDSATVPLRALVNAAQRALLKISFASRLIIGFDELEAFYTDQARFQRDLAMVRDLLFVVDDLNQLFLSNACEVSLLAAVRSEVLFSMKALGQEIERTVHDHGITLSWHHAPRSLKHPLLEMIRKRLRASGLQVEAGKDILFSVFPAMVDLVPIETYLLDGSFYKPRDIVWRLSIIQDQFPQEEKFSETLLQRTANSYSQRLWSEVEYELSAHYPSDDISFIKRTLSGFKRYFTFSEIQSHFRDQERLGENFKRFIGRTDLADLLNNLYRLGAIGNDFPLNSKGKKRANRWIFRNEPDLLINRQMVINGALASALSIRSR